MDHHAIAVEIIGVLGDLGTPERIQQSKHYCPTTMRVAGVTNPDIKAVIKEYRKRFAQWAAKDWIKLCKALVAEGVFEAQVFAFERIGRDKKLLGALESVSYTHLRAHET